MAHISSIRRRSIGQNVQLVACYSLPSCSRDLALFLSIPASLAADWCVILIRSFCAASESISANGWSAVGGGSTEGSPSLSQNSLPTNCKLTSPPPPPWCGVYQKYVTQPLVLISGVFSYFSPLFSLASRSQRCPPTFPPLWACCQPSSRLP